MKPEELMKDLLRQIESHALTTTAVKRSLIILVEQASKPAYHRDSGLIAMHWGEVKAYGLRINLFEKFRGDTASRQQLATFLDSCRPKKGNRERKWAHRDLKTNSP